MRLIFAGTPDFAVPSLRAVAETDHEISLVVTQPDRRRGRGRRISFPPVKKAALELEAEVFQPENVNSPESVERLEAAEAEVGVVVAYGQILSRKVLDTPARGFLNVHASLLPKYRGAAPINWAVIRGEDKTGVSVQRMGEELDAGALLGQKEVDIKARETAGELHDRLAPIGAELLVKVLERMSRQDGLQPKSQDGEPSYAPRLSRKEGDVDWSSAAEDIKNWVRGVTPWPGALTELQTRGGKEKIVLLRVDTIERNEEAEPGTVLGLTENEEIIVQAGQGAIIIKEMQPAGSRAMKAADYVHGHEIEPDDVFR